MRQKSLTEMLATPFFNETNVSLKLESLVSITSPETYTVGGKINQQRLSIPVFVGFHLSKLFTYPNRFPHPIDPWCSDKRGSCM